MSLIPSESYSFPDHFTSTVTPSRKPKQQKPEPEKVRRKPQIVALPDPEPEPGVEAKPVFKPEPIIAADSVFEPEAEPEFVPEIWEPQMPEAEAPAPLPPRSAKPDLMAEIWEPELPEPPKVKAPPPAPPARPAAPPMPNPAVRRAQAPPARIPEMPVRKIALPATLKPKVRWNNRTPAMDPSANRNNGNNANGSSNGTSAAELPAPLMPPAKNVIQMKAAHPVPPVPGPMPRPSLPIAPRQVIPRAPVQPQPPSKPAPAPVQFGLAQTQPAPVPATQRRPAPTPPKPAIVPPKPAPVKANPQVDFFEMFEENAYEAAARRRREMKFRRFIACEAAALLVLLPLVIVGLTLNVSPPALRWIMNILTITAAVAAVVIPIIFYAATPTLPEIER